MPVDVPIFTKPKPPK